MSAIEECIAAASRCHPHTDTERAKEELEVLRAAAYAYARSSEAEELAELRDSLAAQRKSSGCEHLKRYENGECRSCGAKDLEIENAQLSDSVTASRAIADDTQRHLEAERARHADTKRKLGGLKALRARERDVCRNLIRNLARENARLRCVAEISAALGDYAQDGLMDAFSKATFEAIDRCRAADPDKVVADALDVARGEPEAQCEPNQS